MRPGPRLLYAGHHRSRAGHPQHAASAVTPGAPGTPRRVLIPIVCDLRGAPDTPAERIDTYRQLFDDALVARDHTIDGIRFRADIGIGIGIGIEARVREMAHLEAQCCGFFTFAVNTAGGEVLLDATVVDDDTARVILDEFYRLPDTIGGPGRRVRSRPRRCRLPRRLQPSNRRCRVCDGARRTPAWNPYVDIPYPRRRRYRHDHRASPQPASVQCLRVV